MRQFLDVQTTCCDIGGHHHANSTTLKPLQCFRALGLALVAMHRDRRQSIDFQLCGKPLGTKFCLRKHQHLLPVMCPNQMREQGCFLGPIDVNE